ncbi:MAG: hypothetical protein Q9212_005435 [Teloschistes hypoglaucus]
MSGTQIDPTRSVIPRHQSMAQKASWDTLPQEIKTHILSFAGECPPDWKNARLVSRNWAETAAPYVFREISLTPCTMHRLKDVRSLQTIQHHVKHLVLATSIMPKISWQQWKNDFFLLYIYGCTPCPTYLEVAPRYEQYLKLFRQQQRFIDANKVHLTPNSTIEMPPYVAEAMQTFCHLSTVIITEGPWYPRKSPITYYHPLQLWSQTWQDLLMTRIDGSSLQPDMSSAFERTILQNVPKPGKSFPGSYQHLDELPHWSPTRQPWVMDNFRPFFRYGFSCRLCIIKFGVGCETPSDELILADPQKGCVPYRAISEDDEN